MAWRALAICLILPRVRGDLIVGVVAPGPGEGADDQISLTGTSALQRYESPLALKDVGLPSGVSVGVRREGPAASLLYFP